MKKPTKKVWMIVAGVIVAIVAIVAFGCPQETEQAVVEPIATATEDVAAAVTDVAADVADTVVAVVAEGEAEAEGEAVAEGEDEARTDEAVVSGDTLSSMVAEVVSGDTLGSIAAAHYGDSERWLDIAEANDIEDPNVIFPGDKLRLP